MALPHASPGDVIGVRPLGDGFLSAKTHALFKSEDFSVLRLVLLAGASLPAHQVAGEITIHCLEGCLEVTWGRTSKVLHAGEMLLLARHAVHAVKATQNASALLTLALSH